MLSEPAYLDDLQPGQIFVSGDKIVEAEKIRQFTAA